MKTTLLIPTLNEVIGMKAIMPKIRKDWYDQLIILDGGSTDGTVEYARGQGYFVYIQKKYGMRHAYTEAIPLIQGDIVVTFSPDGNSIPETIPLLAAKIKEGNDMVIASRYLAGAKSSDDDAVTAFGNWLFTRTVNLLHRAQYTDAMGILRAYRKSLIHDLELEKDKGYNTAEMIFRTKVSWEPLLSVRAAKRRLKVTEIPADEPARLGGKRKLQIIRWGGAYYFQFFRELFFWR